MKSIHFAVLGFGNIAKTHITALRALPVVKRLPALPVLDTLVTRNPDRHRLQAEAIGFRRTVSSAAEAAGDERVDVFDICTPNAVHYDDVMSALGGGKSIYCEKPVTDRYDRSRRLLEEIEKANPAEQLAFTFRYHPAVMRIREWVRAGVIGEPLQCNISYRRSGYLDPERPVSWRLQSGLSGGGAISDLGVHVLDLIRHWFGELSDVSGIARTYVKERAAEAGSDRRVAVDVDDWAMMHYETASGVSGALEVSRIALGSDAYEIRVVGTRGSLTCDLERQTVPDIHLLKGGSAAPPQPDALELLPGEKATMGIAVDAHFAALHHFLLRLAGEDRWPDLAPHIRDGVTVEYWIERILAASKRNDAAETGGERT